MNGPLPPQSHRKRKSKTAHKNRIQTSNTHHSECLEDKPTESKTRPSKTKTGPPLPTPHMIQKFLKDFYPHVGPSPLAKRTVYLRHVDALLRAYYKKRSDTDRDSMKHRRVRTSGMSLAHLVRQMFSAKMRTLKQLLSKNIDAASIDYVKKLLRQLCITNGIQFAMRGGAWGVKRSQKLKKGVCKIINITNGLSVLSEIRQLKNPIMEETKNPQPRQLHRDRFGLTCASESPEGKSVGLVNTLSVLGCVRTRPMSAWDLIQTVLAPTSLASRHLAKLDPSKPFLDHEYSHAPRVNGRGWMVVANGVPFANVATSIRELYHAFRQDRRNYNNSGIPSTAGFSVWRQDREVRMSTEPGEMFRPLICIRNGKRQNTHLRATKQLAQMVLDNLEESADETKVARNSESFMKAIPSRIQLSVSAYETPSNWYDFIRKGPIEYITKSEECTLCFVRENLLTGDARASHAELHPQAAVMGLSACGVPFANCNQSPRVLYGSAMRKQALGAPIVDPWIGSYSGSLCNPHQPLVNTSALRCLDDTYGVLGTYCQAAVVAVLPLGGYNQEDSYVISQGAVDRGLFYSCERSSKRAHEGQLGTSRIVFGGMHDEHDGKQSAFDERGIRKLGSFVRGGDTLVKRELKSREVMPNPGANSGERKYHTKEKSARHDVQWNASDIERGRVDGIVQWKTGNGGRTVRIRVAQVGPIGVGDKVSSNHGQKGIIARIVADVDMPRTAEGVVPDICINPHALPSRMTVGQLIELVAGKVACLQGSAVDGTPFVGASLQTLMDKIQRFKNGDGRGREMMYDGESGKCMGFVPVGVVSYMALRHRSFRKIQARGMQGRVNCVTKEATEGRRRAGGLRFGEMERDCLIAHGAASILRERLMCQSDGHTCHVCKRCGKLATYKTFAEKRNERRFYCHTCASKGVRDPGDSVVEVQIPYALRVVYNNLAAQNISVKMKVGAEQRLCD